MTELADYDRFCGRMAPRDVISVRCRMGNDVLGSNQMGEDNETTSDVPDEEEFLDGASRAIQNAIEKLHRAGIATVHALTDA